MKKYLLITLLCLALPVSLVAMEQDNPLSQEQSALDHDIQQQKKRAALKAGKELKDLYAVLGLAKTAAMKEIKRGYRTKALELHPDKAKNGERFERTIKFKALNDAYAILSDAKLKKIYDDEYCYAHLKQRCIDFYNRATSLFTRPAKKRESLKSSKALVRFTDGARNARFSQVRVSQSQARAAYVEQRRQEREQERFKQKLAGGLALGLVGPIALSAYLLLF